MQNAKCTMQNAEFMVIVGTGVLVATRSPRGKTILNRFLTLSVSLRYLDCPK